MGQKNQNVFEYIKTNITKSDSPEYTRINQNKSE